MSNYGIIKTHSQTDKENKLDTEGYVAVDSEVLKGINIARLDEQEDSFLKEYIEITRHLIEIESHFHVFLFCQKQITNNYSVKYNDDFERVGDLSDFDDYIAINSLTVNYISAGRVLKDSIEVFVKEHESTFSKEFALTKIEVFSKEYDENRCFRIIDHMRDFYQHGHLLVSVDEGKLCFNFELLLKRPHFNMKSTIKNELNSINQEIKRKNNDVFRLSYCFAIANYTYGIIKIYYLFWKRLISDIIEKYSQFKKIISDNPEVVHHLDNTFDGLLFFRFNCDSSYLHTIDTNEKTDEWCLHCLEEAKKYYEKERIETERVNDNFRLHSIPV